MGKEIVQRMMNPTGEPYQYHADFEAKANALTSFVCIPTFSLPTAGENDSVEQDEPWATATSGSNMI